MILGAWREHIIKGNYVVTDSTFDITILAKKKKIFIIIFHDMGSGCLRFGLCYIHTWLVSLGGCLFAICCVRIKNVGQRVILVTCVSLDYVHITRYK